ncbi:ATP-binding protein [Ureibacillus sp. NPDC094379]
MELATVREEKKLQQSLQRVEQYLERSHLHELSNYAVVPLSNKLMDTSTQKNIRLMEITKIVYDKNEDITEKLVNVFNAVGSLGSALTLLIDSNGQEVKLFIGIRSENPIAAKDGLEKSFRGNFPGTQLKSILTNDINDQLSNMFHHQNKKVKNICSVTGIPALKEVDKKEYIQGLEKLIDSMRGETFSAMFIADAISSREVNKIRQGYEELHTSLFPFQKTDLSVGKNDSQSITKGISEGITNTVNDSLTKTQSFTEGSSEGNSQSDTENHGLNIIKSTIRGFTGGKTGSSRGTTVNYNTNQSNTTGSSSTSGTSRATTSNTSENTTDTEGTSSTMQVHLENKTITSLLEKIDDQLERLKKAEDLGLWNYSCYFIADDEQTARVAATNYQAIIRGDNSALEGSSVTIWNSRNPQTPSVISYLEKLSHPLMQLPEGKQLSQVTSGTLINSRELAIAYGLPRKSVNGVPVIEMAEFGRRVHQLNEKENRRTFSLGQIYYMGQKEETEVSIDIESLAQHTFITGSTGSGKSNTIYRMLDQLNNQNVKFLVIEPAKGEYKAVFGGHRDVHVFGTNPQYAPILKINPFRFPDGIHVLEHIERLIEIFNACWEMSAAMPAVLREAVERVYIETGWDLDHSYHFEGQPVFPTLKQLVDVLPRVIEASGYSEEVKSNYIGALVTRVKSLTTGLFSSIFSDQEVDNTILFDKNCIVDLSRVGSSETKSLLMGILFMRLQEHRMTFTEGMNVPLKHVTVLEEAHHLLRKTSTTQTSEGANLQGKSVEMLTNGIAEMRTYGEGFIIADQSPNLLDASVIRNTNTKIIMRLPDGTDRQEVGASASLNEEQLNEIPKLETGVAIIYQNNWLEPVLCSIHHYTNELPYVMKDTRLQQLKTARDNKTKIVELLLHGFIYPDQPISANKIEESIISLTSLEMPHHVKNVLNNEIHHLQRTGTFKYWQNENLNTVADVISSFINPNTIVYYSQSAVDIQAFRRRCLQALELHVKFRNTKYYTILTQCLLLAYLKQNKSFQRTYDEWFAFESEREVF